MDRIFFVIYVCVSIYLSIYLVKGKLNNLKGIERRDLVHEFSRFLDLSSVLEPGRPTKTDKPAILDDAIRVVNQLKNEAQELKETNEKLLEEIKSLKVSYISFLLIKYYHLYFHCIYTFLLLKIACMYVYINFFISCLFFFFFTIGSMLIHYTCFCDKLFQFSLDTSVN